MKNVDELPSLESTKNKVVGVDFNPDDLHIQAASVFIQNYVHPIASQLGQETINLQNALGRVLAEAITSPINVPPADNSAMDGYAFNSQCLKSGSDIITLRIKSTVLAGQNLDSALDDFDILNDSIKIMTGAVIPKTCDTVIPQENVEVSDHSIFFKRDTVPANANVRKAGEDLSKGQIAIPAGRILTPSDLGLIASIGISRIKVTNRLKVAIVSTGNEIQDLDQPLKPGGIYDSNRFTLLGMLTRLGVDIIDLGTVKDDPTLLKNAFIKATEQAQVIITSGGVSVGQADYTKKVMAELGEIAFWKLAMKPGRPMAFGKISSNNKEAVIFGLPGNPVAVMITFYQFVKNTLLQMAGASHSETPLLQAHIGIDYKKRPGRTEFIRATLTKDESGKIWATPLPNQGSGILSSMSRSNCLIILSHESSNLQRGSVVDIATFEGLI